MMLLVNHGVCLGIQWRTPVEVVSDVVSVSGASSDVERVLGVIARVHQRAWSADAGGGLTLYDWCVSVAHTPALRDATELLVRLLTHGPFVEANPEADPFEDLVVVGCAGPEDSVLISVADRGSPLTMSAYRGTAALWNLRSQAEVREWVSERERAKVVGMAASLEAISRTCPDVRIPEPLRAGLLRGTVSVSPSKVVEVARGLQAACYATRQGFDWVEAFGRVCSSKLRDESDTVHASPSLRRERMFLLEARRRELCTWHVDVAKGDRAYIRVDPDGTAYIAHIGPHLSTKKH